MLAVAMALMIIATAGATPPAPRIIFQCTIGTHEVVVEQAGDRFDYRYTSTNGTELALSATTGNRHLLWYQILFARGSQESLRFASGRYGYAVYSDHQLAMQDFSASTEKEPVFYGDTVEAAGLVVLRGNRVIAHHRCDDDAFISVDWATAQRLRRDPIGGTLFRLP